MHYSWHANIPEVVYHKIGINVGSTYVKLGRTVNALSN